ncbi:MAG: hypothetical protein RLY76_288 [Actinomycetota bacterium]|jgi:hypothetical protein
MRLKVSLLVTFLSASIIIFPVPSSTAATIPTTWTLVAAGQRSVVFGVTSANATTLNNSTYFYYNSSSMGFAPNATITQNSADTTNSSINGGCTIANAGNKRLSWHGYADASITGGWRVGCTDSLNSSMSAVRAIYQSNSPIYYPAGPQLAVDAITITNGGWTLCWNNYYGESSVSGAVKTACTGTYLLLAGFDGVAPDTTAPTITSSATFSVAENQTSIGTATANETVTWSKISGDDSATVTINSSTGVMAFISARDFENPTDVGRNNVYNLTIRATDTAGNTSQQSISITVTDVVDTSSFNSFSVSGAPSYRTVVTITANVTVAAKVTFRAKNVIISGCKNKLATGSGSTFSATCTWKPSVRGAVTLTATAVPTSGSISSSTATPLNVIVGNKSGGR